MPAILGLRTQTPQMCGCCGRASTSVGAVETPGMSAVLWSCDACKVDSVLKVLGMNVMKLDKLESDAIGKAIKEVSADIVELVLTSMWEGGLTDLSKVDESSMLKIAGKVTASPTLHGIAAKMLVLYSNELRRVVALEKAGV